MIKKNRSFGPILYKDAPNPLWSVTRIDALGNSKCFSHFPTNGQALEQLDIVSEQIPDIWDQLAVMHHYGKCCFCGAGDA